MKYMNNKLLVRFAVLMFANMCGIAFGYNFTFHNKTDKSVAVKINLGLSTDEFDGKMMVEPGKQHIFAFVFPDPKFGFCLSKVSYGFAQAHNDSFVEADKYEVAQEKDLGTKRCQDLAFDITVDKNGKLMLSSHREK